jgi:hypothetical protein
MTPLNILKKSGVHLTLFCSLLVMSTFLITGTRASTRSTSLGSIHHVFLIMVENHSSLLKNPHKFVCKGDPTSYEKLLFLSDE